MSSRSIFQGVVFDMDGLLINSEPIWEEVEGECLKEYDVELTPQLCQQTKSFRVIELVEHWLGPKGISTEQMQRVAKNITAEVATRVIEKAEPLPGMKDALELVKRQKFSVAVASSSPPQIIAAVVEKFGLADYLDCWCSSEDERYGKPHPSVYLSACKKLKLPPTRCLSLEDSLNGVISAKSARMYCIAVPPDYKNFDRRLLVADAVIPSLESFNEALLDRIS